MSWWGRDAEPLERLLCRGDHGVVHKPVTSPNVTDFSPACLRYDATMNASPTRPTWLIKRRGTDTVLQLSGDWVATETGVRDPAVAHQVITEAHEAKRLYIDTSGLGRWDSALIVFLQELQHARGPATGLATAARGAAAPPGERHGTLLCCPGWGR